METEIFVAGTRAENVVGVTPFTTCIATKALCNLSYLADGPSNEARYAVRDPMMPAKSAAPKTIETVVNKTSTVDSGRTTPYPMQSI